MLYEDFQKERNCETQFVEFEWELKAIERRGLVPKNLGKGGSLHKSEN
ncbi:MAG: hypothetical protein GTO45_29530 [Candidatus Aminicenantes bacterium]|nr:hypothetical protein [Candidatus Aminicenantes bacterium]NIN22312.1 hypothetical protein [Candidatus Aminicenantes bacterium]NIN46080.1 hypothetical protein [Candidatus Aminicenantes bacterium]NIN88916.1 hypothetical protein [Candidatus Aminicenantes bacterium]NIO85389.1 hypothetical protein [Candidatus Aminicenantes bacterium]